MLNELVQFARAYQRRSEQNAAKDLVSTAHIIIFLGDSVRACIDELIPRVRDRWHGGMEAIQFCYLGRTPYEGKYAQVEHAVTQARITIPAWASGEISRKMSGHLCADAEQLPDNVIRRDDGENMRIRIRLVLLLQSSVVAVGIPNQFDGKILLFEGEQRLQDKSKEFLLHVLLLGILKYIFLMIAFLH